jgi:cytochrome c oxidase subunit 4
MSEGQTHPLSVYFWIWGLLFVLSAFSYAVDYMEFQGIVRWALILIFMFLKAGFIIAIFMHMVWERMAFAMAILAPPVVLLFFIGLMQIEGGYTEAKRIEYFGDDVAVYEVPHSAAASEEDH